MPLDPEFLLNVKEHVSAKLKNLGAFIDEELPDYIMVMVANNKSESSMAKDLQLFLGDHTIEFTQWLHTTLDKLKNRGKSKPSEQASDTSKSKPIKHKPIRTDESSAAESHSARRTRRRSRSRSPLTKRATELRSSREPHGSEVLSLSVEDDYINDDISSSVAIKEERKVVSTASLVSKGEPAENTDEDNTIDSTQDNTTIRSVIKVKEPEVRRRPKVNRNLNESLRPVGRLLKQAVSEAKASVLPPPDAGCPVSRSKSVTSVRSAAHDDVSSSEAKSEKTKFFVTLSGPQRRHQRSVPADSSDSANWGSGDRHVSRSTGVKARLGDRRMVPYARPTKLSAKERLGPVASSTMERKPIISTSTEDFDREFSPADGDVDDLDLVQEVDISEEVYPPSPDNRTVGVEKVRLVDRLNQKQLVVTLNDADDDDDLVPLASDRTVTRKNLDQETPVNQSGDQVKVPSSLERCKYWPKCRNGDQCQYIHPTEPCSTFPRCRLGDRCVYIHPPCRFDAACTRDDCPFSHTVKRMTRPTASALPSVSPSQVVCRFQDRCTNIFCPFYHPPAPTIPRLLTVRPFVSSTRAVATPCRFGVNCTNSACPFTHPDQQKPDQFKWVAPSKQKQQQQQPPPHTTVASTSSPAASAPNLAAQTTSVK